ncbi:MAG: circadian clock KaiB family protein [Methylovirgula sp.]
MKNPAAESGYGEATPTELPVYKLRLFVSGATPNSARAIANIKAIGQAQLQGRYELEVIDAYQQAELLRGEDIVALPTLIKSLPLPMRRMVGDMSDDAEVLLVLGLEAETGKADAAER